MTQRKKESSAQDPAEAAPSFFDRYGDKSQEMRIKAMAKLEAEMGGRARQFGLVDTALRNWLEDCIQEGFIKAEEQSERYDAGLSSPSHWIFLKSRDVANRWFERYILELKKIQDLIGRGSSMVHDVQGAAQDPTNARETKELVAEVIARDLSLSDARVLKLYHGGSDIEEIAELEGLSVETAQRRLNRAQARARKARAARDSQSDQGRPAPPKPPLKSQTSETRNRYQRRRLSP